MKKDKKNNFKTPEGYFESFHDRLMDRIQEEEAEASSIIPKSDGFSVPEGYFDAFTEKVVSQIDQKEVKVVQLKSYRKFYYSAAAIAAVFLLIFGLNWKTESPVAFDDLANAEIDEYFDATDLNLSTYEIAEAVSLENLDLNDILENQLDEEHLLEYLDENVDDIEELNLEYDDYE